MRVDQSLLKFQANRTTLLQAVVWSELRRHYLTHINFSPTVDSLAFVVICDPFSISRDKMKLFSLIRDEKNFWPRGVIITWKKPFLVINVCTSPPFIRFNTIARRGQKGNKVLKTVFHLNRLKFVLICYKRQGVEYFSFEDSIKIEGDNIGWVPSEDGY